MIQKNKNIILTVLIALFVIGLVTGVFIISGRYLGRKQDKVSRQCDKAPQNSHLVMIKDGKAIPEHTDAPLCDTLTITNLDSHVREMAFGLHEEHETYDGVTEISLKEGESVTVTLIKAGNFRFHDHIKDDSQGTFTVTNP